MRRRVHLGALLCLAACSRSSSSTGPSAVAGSGGAASLPADAGASRPPVDARGSSPPSQLDASMDVAPDGAEPIATGGTAGSGGSPGPAPSADGSAGATGPDGLPPEPRGDSGVPSAPDGVASMPWLAFNFAPSSRTVLPVATRLHGTVGPAGGGLGMPVGATGRLNGAGAGITFDFGREVAGIASLGFGAASDNAQRVRLAFTESSQYIGPSSDQSIGPTTLIDGALAVPAPPASTYVMPANKLRGGFRYLGVYLDTPGWLDITALSVNFTAAPSMAHPSAYPNYFYSNDTLLDRIWYAGAYTVQLDTIDPKQGRAFPYPAAGTNWDNSATVGVGVSVLADGAKRDRTVWPGDLGIALPTAYVSTGDLLTMRNTLDTLFAGQDSDTGEFPRSGPPLNRQNSHTTSDTYHLWTLVGAGNYYLYSADRAWLDRNWAAYKQGLAFSTAKIAAASRLFEVNLVSDWGRLGQGGANIAANAILYRVLTASAPMAIAENDAALAATYTAQAAAIKTAANSLLWDATAGAFRDNLTSAVHPQDGNALAIWFGLVDTPARAQAILASLRKNWNEHGARTPEADPTRATISPFPGSMEVAARLAAGDDQGGLDLMRLEWGYMLDAPIGTGSTFWEGYLDDGSFGYGGSYMSAAHGWSSGPTFALTGWVLGVAPDTAAGQSFHVIPHVGDLTHVEGALTMAPGKVVRVAYDHPACGDFTLHVDSSSHLGSVGVVGVPKFGQTRVVQLNGATAWDGTRFVVGTAAASADQDGSYIYFRGLLPGRSVFTYSPTSCP